MIDCEFTKKSREIVERYLKTVVVVDDHGQLDKPTESQGSILTEEVVSPPKRSRIGAAASSTEKVEAIDKGKTSEEILEQDRLTRFNAKLVIGSFADRGVNCTFLEPTGQRDLENLPVTISKLAPTSDILILDWSFGDAGVATTKLVQNLVHYDENNRDRLRLIVIYTIESRIIDILQRIKTAVEGITLGPKVKEKKEDYALLIGSTKIVALLKEAAPIPKETEELLNRKVSFNKLAERVIEEFTDMTHGIVPNVALLSLAEIRDNTSKLLRRFSSDLDAPYLTHRTILENPSDAEDHIVTLIAEELSAILEEKDVKQAANSSIIKIWAEYKKPEDNKFTFEHDGQIYIWPKEKVIELIQKGISSIDFKQYDGLSNNACKNAHSIKLSKMYHCNDKSSDNLDEQLAVIFTLKSFYGNPIPKLNLGTIIRLSEKDEYYICIQPRCDCVRITEPTDFVFLLFKKTESKKFDIVLKDNGDYIHLIAGIKGNSIKNFMKLIKFPVNIDGNDTILATNEGQIYLFKDVEGIKYSWIGELKGDQALRLSNEFSNNLSRIGLHESEWLRRSSK